MNVRKSPAPPSKKNRGPRRPKTITYCVFASLYDDEPESFQRIFTTEALAQAYADTFPAETRANVVPLEVTAVPVHRVTIHTYMWSQRVTESLRRRGYDLTDQEPIDLSYDSDNIPEHASRAAVEVRYSTPDDPQGPWICVEGIDHEAVRTAFVTAVEEAEKKLGWR